MSNNKTSRARGKSPAPARGRGARNNGGDSSDRDDSPLTTRAGTEVAGDPWQKRHGRGRSPAPPSASKRSAAASHAPAGKSAAKSSAKKPAAAGSAGATLIDHAAAFLGARDSSALLPLAVTHANIAVYAAAYWMTMPVLPYLSRELGASQVLLGYLRTLFSVVQLVGGPLIGRVCDAYGARLALIVSQVGSAASYGLLALAFDVPTLFLSQLPTVAMHSMHAAQAFVTDFSAPERRAAALGRLSLSYGLGMVTGASLGGFLGKHTTNATVAALAMALCLATTPLNMAVLPGGRAAEAAGDDKANKADKAGKDGKGGKKGGGLALEGVIELLKVDVVRALVGFQVILGIGISSYQNAFSSYLSEPPFNVAKDELGYLMSVGGMLGMVANVVVVPVLLARLSEAKVLIGACLVVASTLAAFSFASSTQQLLMIMVPQGLASSAVYTVGTSVFTKAVSAHDTGTAIGFSHATRSFTGVLAPTLAGHLYAWNGHSAVGGFASAMTLTAVAWLVLGGGGGGGVLAAITASESKAKAAAKKVRRD